MKNEIETPVASASQHLSISSRKAAEQLGKGVAQLALDELPNPLAIHIGMIAEEICCRSFTMDGDSYIHDDETVALPFLHGPELLAALKGCLPALQASIARYSGGDDSAAYAAARAAISAATGGRE